MNKPATDAERAAVDELLDSLPAGWDGNPLEGRLAFSGLHRSQQLRHLLLPALAAVQSSIGWVSPGALDYICATLIVPPAEAYGVATFYALISTTKLASITVHVCDDICCAGRGSEEIIAALRGRLGEARSPDGVATWITSPCLGQCDRAPAVFIQRAGQPDLVIAPADSASVFAAIDGVEPAITTPTKSTTLLGRPGGKSLEAYQRGGGYVALAIAASQGPDRTIAEIKASNLRGRGGAAFPAGIKWEAVAGIETEPKYVICNADESEPGTFKDRDLIESNPHALVEAMTIAGFATGANRGYIYIRGEYPMATARLRTAIREVYAAGLLGSDVGRHGFTFDLELRRGQGAYICGEETALMNSIEGKRGEPRNKPPFPTVSGLFGKPTVINNVETLVNVIDIIEHGGETWAQVGTTESTGPKLFCLSGAVAKPGVYEVPFGATLGELLDLAGGVTGDIQAILLGGAAGSFVTGDELDIPLTFEGSRAAGVSLGSGVIMVFDTSTDMTGVARRLAQFFRDESCGQCVPCRVGTARIEENLARKLHGHGDLDLQLIDDIDVAMKDASICGLGHTAATAVRSLIDLGLI
jgi:NADH-quinone oxidoreductase subunit F